MIGLLWYFLLKDELSSWEQRIGSFQVTCGGCNQHAWQLTFRMYRTSGNTFSPASPAGFAQAECYQVRCTSCGAPTRVQHPTYWAGSLGTPYHDEAYPPTAAVPAYATAAFYFGP